MKKFLHYFMVLAAVVMAGALTISCDKEETFESGNIVGSWNQTNDAGTKIVVTFNKDSTGSVAYSFTNGDSRIENFTYDYHKDNRYLKVLETSCQLCGEYDISVSAKRIELNGFNYYVGDYVWYVFTR